MNSSTSLAPSSAGPSMLIPKLPVTFNFFKNPKKKQTNAPLPLDFKPFPYSVICGRGKACSESVGNRRLKVIASTFLEKYATASNKEEKSSIVTEIIDIIEDACPDQRGTFIRLNNDGRWWVVDAMVAREKVGSLMRDMLHNKYKSSSKSKQARRRSNLSLRGSITSVSTASTSCSSSSTMFQDEDSSSRSLDFDLFGDDDVQGDDMQTS